MANLTGWRRDLVDWINLVLALALFLAPWALGFAGDTAPAWNAWVSAAAITALAFAAIQAFAEWEEWINLAFGLWVVIAPWALGFAGTSTALWSHVLLGALVAALSAWNLWLIRQAPPRVTT